MESCESKSVLPLFHDAYPKDDELRALVDAFEAGNFHAVREGAARIVASDKSDDVKAAARDLKARTKPSRAQLALLVITALLVVALSGYEIAQHGRNAPHPVPPKPTIERVH
jgi:hypothetical protein